jgi:hypothetical protein
MRILFLLISFLTFNGYSQNKLLDILPSFTKDSTHIYPTAYTNLNAYQKQGTPFGFFGKRISQGLLNKYNVFQSHSKSTKFYALEKFDFGSSLYGLVVGLKEKVVEDSRIAIWLIDGKSDSLINKYNLAYYKTIPGTMEETMNAWIVDLDKDGDLDIGIMINLVDYELADEISENISGVEGYGYYIQDGRLSYDYLSKENYQNFLIKR